MSRARGFVTAWRPQARTVTVLAQVDAILAEYRDYLPMTVRQIFYRLVGAHAYPKTEAAYESLGNMLVMARRAGRIRFAAIRDDGVTVQAPWGYGSVAEFWDVRLSDDWTFQFERQAEQPRFVEVWAEAAGMVPLVAQAVEGYGVPVYSSGGFDSLTAKHSAARRIVARDVPTVVLHVGDHDPSGVALFQAAAEDVAAMAGELGGTVTFIRAAVTVAQIAQHDLPSAPAKAHDKRSAWTGGGTVQVEAFPPDVLAAEVTNAVEGHLDLDAYQTLLDREHDARDRIAATMRALRAHWRRLEGDQ